MNIEKEKRAIQYLKSFELVVIGNIHDNPKLLEEAK